MRSLSSQLLRIGISLFVSLVTIALFTKRRPSLIAMTILRSYASALTARGALGREWFVYAASILIIIKTSIDAYGDTRGIVSRVVSFWLTGAPESLDDLNRLLPYVLWAIPFIWLGLGLCVMRLRDAGLPRIFAPLFFVPAINILLFIACLILPSARNGQESRLEATTKGIVARLVPDSKLGIAGFSVLVCALIGVLGVLFGAYGFGNYGAPLFLGLPFFMGFLSSLLYGAREPRTIRECTGIALLAICVTALALVCFLIEGLLCIAALFPIACVCCVIGACVGFGVQKLPPGRRNALQSSLLCGLALVFGATLPVDDSRTLSSQTTIRVSRHPADVWRHVVAFSEIDPPKEWLFLQGVAYPMRARIEGIGVGAIRYCEFSTGPFVEPITVWKEPHELRFTVTQTPPALTEWNPLGTVIAPHLKGYFQSLGGQFLLTEIAPGVTEIRATTWYTHKVAPVWYWSLISDPILHLIHSRVLEHIKVSAESQ
jgi:uncharacterized membrane protein YhaH (DUF805 family)